MNQLEILAEHHRVCDELHQLALEENRFLRTNERAPEPAMVEKKRGLLEALDRTLAALRSLPAASARTPEARSQLEGTRARILQILQLDKENEQLLLRFSLAGGRVTKTPAPSPSAHMLQKIYSRCS